MIAPPVISATAAWATSPPYASFAFSSSTRRSYEAGGGSAGVIALLPESEVGEKLWQARSKGVAHYDVVRSGDDWRLWRVDGTGLTWGQINTYVDTCSEAIEVLLALVRQTSFDFEGSKEVAQGYVDEFIDALVRGLQSQKQEQAEKRDRLIRGTE